MGVAEQLFDCINKADMDTRPAFYGHIVLSGGSTMFPGLPSRLEKEMKKLYLDKVCKGKVEQLAKFKCRIEDPPRRKHVRSHSLLNFLLFEDGFPWRCCTCRYYEG